jgi:nudix-type nucleoside diphosphatase (YffH/AdpP family)
VSSFLRVRTVYEGWARYLVATVRLADGHEVEREIEDHGRAVCVLPYDPERRLALLVTLFRAAAHFAGAPPEMLEAPAGLLEEDDPEDGARREVLEETGVRLQDLEPVATVWTMPGISTERMSLYLAPYTAGDRIAAGGGVAGEHEGITVVEMPLAELASMAARGEVADLKTLTLVLALGARRPDLLIPVS